MKNAIFVSNGQPVPLLISEEAHKSVLEIAELLDIHPQELLKNALEKSFLERKMDDAEGILMEFLGKIADEFESIWYGPGDAQQHLLFLFPKICYTVIKLIYLAKPIGQPGGWS